MLTGFGDFLERRRVIFAEPLPSTRVCGVCGTVPSQSLLLPCGHILCPLCMDQIAKETVTCPLDNKAFTETDLTSVTFQQSCLEQLRIFCVAGGQKCSFSGTVSELKEHLVRCCSDQVTCAKCQRSVVRSFAVQHCRQCTAETVPMESVNTTTIPNVVEKLSGMKRDLEGVRKKASSGNIDQDAVVNGANSLVERMTSLESDLIQIGKKTDEDQCRWYPPTVKKAAAKMGPYRAASKPGACITTCQFRDVYAGYSALNSSKKEHRLSAGTHTLAGYTFKLDCKLLKQEDGVVVLNFILFLRDGVWDDSLEWPFFMKATIVVTHPRDEERDVRLPVRMEGPEVVKKPGPGSSNCGYWTKGPSWKDLELQGFFHSKQLYVNVEFE